MPVRLPDRNLAAFPSYPEGLSLKDSAARWAGQVTEWVARTQDLLYRNWLQLEQSPTARIGISTAGITLSTLTTGDLIPGMSVTRTIQQGNDIHVTAVFDIEMTTGIGIGELRVTYPSGETSVQPAAAILQAPARATVAQQWVFTDPPPGGWTFAAQGRATTIGGTVSTQHSNLVVTIL